MNIEDNIAVIADDYTGACDAGVHFSKNGKHIDFLVDGDNLSELLKRRNGIAITTESRFLEPADARHRVARITKLVKEAGFKSIFKKVDSTMRGNPGSEIEAVLMATSLPAALICPAIPQLQRICRDTNIYVNDTILHKSNIGNDPFNPVASSSIIDLLRQQTALPIGLITLKHIEAGGDALSDRVRTLLEEGNRLLVADAASEVHLLALAHQVVSAHLLPVGAGGLAKAVATLLGSGETSDSIYGTLCGPVLAVVGSLTDISRLQADIACNNGRFLLFEITPDDSALEIEQSCSNFIDEVKHDSSRNILLRLSPAQGKDRASKDEAERVARSLGFAAALICRSYRCKTVYSTGGSTSMAVAKALEIPSVTLVDELASGIVLGHFHAPHTEAEWFVSKAGGFGNKQMLTDLAYSLSDETNGNKHHVI